MRLVLFMAFIFLCEASQAHAMGYDMTHSFAKAEGQVQMLSVIPPMMQALVADQVAIVQAIDRQVWAA